MVDNPTNYPDLRTIALAEEPMTSAHIYTPANMVLGYYGTLSGTPRYI